MLTGCKPELQKQLNQTAARYRKGYEILERYEGKLSRTVLRRGGASNRLSLRIQGINTDIFARKKLYQKMFKEHGILWFL